MLTLISLKSNSVMLVAKYQLQRKAGTININFIDMYWVSPGEVLGLLSEDYKSELELINQIMIYAHMPYDKFCLVV